MAMASFPAVLAAEQGWAVSQDHQQCEQAISGLPGKREQLYLPLKTNFKPDYQTKSVKWQT